MSQDAAAPELNPEIELHCRISTPMLGPLREFVANVSRQLEFSEQQVHEIEICVDEACANALEHGYAPFEREFPGRDLKIQISFHTDRLTVRITDQGCGSDMPICARIRHLEEYLDSERDNYRGLGLFLIQKFMDHVDVKTTPGKGTMVEMVKIRR